MWPQTVEFSKTKFTRSEAGPDATPQVFTFGHDPDMDVGLWDESGQAPLAQLVHRHREDNHAADDGLLQVR
jgi:hypothetical protein